MDAQIDFALDNVAKNGWGAFHGAHRAGVGDHEGIGWAPQTMAGGPFQSTPDQQDAGQPPPPRDQTAFFDPQNTGSLQAQPDQPFGLGGYGGGDQLNPLAFALTNTGGGGGFFDGLFG